MSTAVAGVTDAAAGTGRLAGTELLRVEGLTVQAPRGTSSRRNLLQDVGFTVSAGEIVGLVGESGSGKTMTGLGILGLLPEWANVQGRILYNGEDLQLASSTRRRALRGSKLSMIFQEPRAALNPALPMGAQISDVLRTHLGLGRREAKELALTLLAQVGLPHPRTSYSAYAHELSGGMCQRVMIAMALSCGPDLLIADEPTTALDVTIQAQIMDLLRRVAAERRVAVLLISHNLALVASLCNRVITMYSGEVVNIDSKARLLTNPRHPYVRSLLESAAATVNLQSEQTRRAETAVLVSTLKGCRYAPRCPLAVQRCADEHPQLEEIGDAAETRCWRHAELQPPGSSE